MAEGVDIGGPSGGGCIKKSERIIIVCFYIHAVALTAPQTCYGKKRRIGKDSA